MKLDFLKITKMQSKKQSIIETITSTAIGYTVSFISLYLIFPIFGIVSTTTDNLLITLYFTVISLIRGFCVRRWFNFKYKPFHHIHSLSKTAAELNKSITQLSKTGLSLKEGEIPITPSQQIKIFSNYKKIPKVIIAAFDFKQEKTADIVFEKRYNQKHYFTSLKISKNKYIEWDQITKLCKIVKTTKQGDIVSEKQIKNAQHLIRVIIKSKNKKTCIYHLI